MRSEKPTVKIVGELYKLPLSKLCMFCFYFLQHTQNTYADDTRYIVN